MQSGFAWRSLEVAELMVACRSLSLSSENVGSEISLLITLYLHGQLQEIRLGRMWIDFFLQIPGKKLFLSWFRRLCLAYFIPLSRAVLKIFGWGIIL